MFFTVINVIKEEMINTFQRLLYILGTISPVSYTHLDVYKRQIQSFADFAMIEKSLHL